MVQDKNNMIFTNLMDYLKTEYPKIDGGTKADTEKIPSFPYVYFFQIDASTRLTTLSNTEDGINLAFQIEVYTDKGINKAREISNAIRNFMIEEGFICQTFNPVQIPSNVSRFIARYGRLDV